MILSGTIPDRYRKAIHKAWGDKLITDPEITPKAHDIHLCSGNGLELKAWLKNKSDTPGIFSLQGRVRRVHLDKSTTKSYLVAHKIVGGVTDAMSKFYIRNCPDLQVPHTVPRSVGSVLDHKRYISLSHQPEQFIHPGENLPIRHPDIDIKIPTRLSSIGYAFRRLSPTELCLAWDFPRWGIPDRPVTTDVTAIQPLKAGLSLVDTLFDTMDFPGTNIKGHPLDCLPAPSHDSRGHFIPSLGIWLPLEWIDSTLITGKAVKIDSAAIPEHLWNKRITLPLKCPEHPLATLRRFLHTRACYNVLLSFFIFMVHTHPVLWLDWLKLYTNQLAFPWFFEAIRRVLVQFVRASTRQQGGKATEPLNEKPQSLSTDVTDTPPKFGLDFARTLLNNVATLADPTQRHQILLTPTTDMLYSTMYTNKRKQTTDPHTTPTPLQAIAINSTRTGGYLPLRRTSTTSYVELKEFTRNLIVGQEACLQYSKSTWWKWNNGSALLFWRWPTQESAQAARDGFPLFIHHDRLPQYKVPQRKMTEEMAQQVGSKISDVLRKTYISRSDKPKSFIDFFGVPKGVGENGEILDIRIVYNGTSCGLNDAVWAPNFWLPTPNTAIRQLSYGYWVMDLDLGEMFLNFPVPENIRPYLGVPINQIAHTIKGVDPRILEMKCVTWTRLLMGFRPSPFFSIKFYYHAEEFIIGDRTDESNPFQYHKIILNLPGRQDFDPRLPWVMKWNEDTNTIAAAIITFVDDVRASGATLEIVWQAAQRLAKRLQYLGIQHAPRKLRPPSRLQTGAWAGGITEASDTAIFKSITQAKWDKVLPIIDRIEGDQASSIDNTLDYKQLEKDRGFLVHVAMTYKVMNAHLKGLHQTIDSWRPNRDDDGWKMKAKDWTAKLAAISDDNLRNQLIESHTKGHPPRVSPAKRLTADLAALRKFFSAGTPTKVSMRASRIFQVNYGFGDASGDGFGDNWLTPSGIAYHHGTWSPDISSESSNYREFRNVIDSIEREGNEGRLRNAFLIFATDNWTVEAALFKGTSDSPKLLEMVIEFHTLQMKYGFEAIVTHVSGYRMIQQGGDGLSRGALNEGVMGGAPYRSFIPFHMSSLTREPQLKNFINRILEGHSKPLYLTPMDWFQRAHDITGGHLGPDGMWRPHISKGTYIWDLPPAACDVALEELRKARIKRHESTHVVLCPRLMTPLWMKQLFKCCDLVVEIPPLCEYWNTNMCEPCVLGFCFPYLNCKPWILRGTPKMLQLHRKLSKMWKTDQMGPISLLHELCLLKTPTVFHPQEATNKKWRQKRPDDNSYDYARPGDHIILTPFQCNLCAFRRIKQRDPCKGSSSDDLLLIYIRRANLDSFWSRASSTVSATRNTIQRTIKSLQKFGLEGPFYDPGPSSIHDNFGYEIAVAVLDDSRKEGKYYTDHKQWDSIRRVKSAIGNFERVSMDPIFRGASFVSDNRSLVSRLNTGGATSYWQHRFLTGCKARMGVDKRPNVALSVDLWKLILTECSRKARSFSKTFESDKWIMAGAFLAFGYVLSLRGTEGFLMDIYLLQKHKDIKQGFVWLPLYGKLKGGSSPNTYLMRSIEITGSGINIKSWRDQLLSIHDRAKRNAGPAFCDKNGYILSSNAMNELLWEATDEIFHSNPELFPSSITSTDSIRTYIQIDRTMRRTATSQATRARVSGEDIDIATRWSRKERARGQDPSEHLRHHHAQQDLLNDCLKRFQGKL